MWGGNIPSTLAGEFAHSLGFAFAVLFIGVLYRGIVKGKSWKSPAAVLAFGGLCHPVAFLNGVTPGVFFLFDRKRFVGNLRYLMAVYFGAVALMAFWLVPLMVKIGYATSINWKWHFASVWDLLPRILWPRAAPRGVRRPLDAAPEDRGARKGPTASSPRRSPSTFRRT